MRPGRTILDGAVATVAALLPAMAAAMVVPGPDADTCAGPVLVFETPASGECNAEVALAQ